jgi:hypothetical protein
MSGRTTIPPAIVRGRKKERKRKKENENVSEKVKKDPGHSARLER